MNPEDYCVKCPHCGFQTDIDPALVHGDDPMLYCPECDHPLFGNPVESKTNEDYPHEKPYFGEDLFWRRLKQVTTT